MILRCHVCSKPFEPRYNLGRRARVCTATSHKCQRKIQKLLDGRKKILPCSDRCCRSRYRVASATAYANQSIDQRKFLNPDEFAAVVRASTKLENPYGIAIRFVAETGVRVGEALLVQRKSFRFDEDPVAVEVPTLKRSGRPIRKVHLHGSAFVVEIRKHLQTVDDAAPAFVIPKRTLQAKFKQLMKRAGIVKDTGIHVLRHTRASQLLHAGATLDYVRGQLGWSSIELLKIYAHTDVKSIKKIGENLQVGRKP